MTPEQELAFEAWRKQPDFGGQIKGLRFYDLRVGFSAGWQAATDRAARVAEQAPYENLDDTISLVCAAIAKEIRRA